MEQTAKKGNTAAKPKPGSPKTLTDKIKKTQVGIDLSDVKASVEGSFSGKSASGSPDRNRGRKKGIAPKGINVDALDAIDERIPFSRSFVKKIRSHDDTSTKNTGLIKNIRSNVKGLFDNMRVKELDKERVIKLRQTTGNLKKTAVGSYVSSSGGEAPSPAASGGQKTKRQLLEEKRESLQQKSKKVKSDKATIGMRIEIDKLRKKHPGDKNLTVLSGILTCKDGCLNHRTIDEKVSSLFAALQGVGNAIYSDYLTTFSVDTFFDIYFLYLEALKKMILEKFKKISVNQSKVDTAIIDSIRRDVRVLNVLLEQKKFKKTITNVAKKLNGFGYPFVNLSPLDVARTFDADKGKENEKVGPGTVKLNKFLIRIYLNVFAQIPLLQPIAKKLCDSLPPNEQNSRVIIANVTLDNAATQLKISKANKDSTVQKQVLSIFNYGKQFVENYIKENANSIIEARVLLKTAEMAEEYTYITDDADQQILIYGHKCATNALSYFQDEAAAVIRRMYDMAEARKINLEE